MNIITNNHLRPLACILDLPEKVRADFDVVENYDLSYRFVQYRGAWYDVYDTQSVRDLGFDNFKGWDGIISDTFFSGVLFRLVGDDEVIVGRYFA